MLQFAWPWAAFAVVLPILTVRLLPRAAALGEGALRFPALFYHSEFADNRSPMPSRRRLLTAVLIWLLLIFAACRPQWASEPVSFPLSGRDLMLALDLSSSMEQRDMVSGDHAVSRFEIVKQVATDFIERRRGDRIGIIVFGRRAHLYVPLTFDQRSAQQLLDETSTTLTGSATALGDAIGLAIKQLLQRPAQSRVLILLSDGAANAGVDPREAAGRAAGEGLRIHTIGVGSSAGELDEATLIAIARRTGGQYFRARDGAELETIYRLLDRLEPVPVADVDLHLKQDLFHWPLALALLLALALGIPAALRGWRPAAASVTDD
jgi:Ca-activated chloride channel family protein